MKKITLLLMTKKGLESLKAIIVAFGPDIIDRVYVRNDTSLLNDYCEDIVTTCYQNKIHCYRNFDNIEINTEIAIAISWRWLIHSEKKVIVLHDSLLPKYRGWNPLVTSLINGDTQVGVSAFIAEEDVDSGEVILQESIPISYPIKIEEVIDLLIPVYRRICLDVINGYSKEGGIDPLSTVLYEPEVSYSMWRDERDYAIDWHQPAVNIMNFVNAVGFPYMGAVSFANGAKVKVLDCDLYPDVSVFDRPKQVGKVLFKEDGKYVVVTKDGLLKLNEVVGWNGEELKTDKFRIRFNGRDI